MDKKKDTKYFKQKRKRGQRNCKCMENEEKIQ